MSKSLTLALCATLLLMSACGQREAGVHRIEVETGGDIVWKGWSPARLVVDGDTLAARVHCRGGGSSRYYKHSLAVKLDERMPFCGLPAGKNWILNASYIDKTFLRHKLCYDLFRAMNPGTNRASLCTYARVDGQERGLYVVMQKLTASVLGVSKTDSTSVIFKEPRIMQDSPFDPQEPDNPYQQAYPKKRLDDRTAQIEALRQFLTDSPDSLFRAEIGSVFDLDNVADWHLLILLANNSDGILKGFFLYKQDDRTPFRIAPWDYDHSFGRDGDNEYNMLTHNADCDRSVLLRRLGQWPAYRTRLAARWQSLREQGIVSEAALERMIDSDARRIRAAVADNEKIWPTDDEHYYDDNRFDDEVAIMKQFIRRNIQRLDTLLAQPHIQS